MAVGAAVRGWGHVRCSRRWRFNLDRAAVALLERHGWSAAGRRGLPDGRRAGRALPRAARGHARDRARVCGWARVTGVARARRRQDADRRARAGAVRGPHPRPRRPRGPAHGPRRDRRLAAPGPRPNPAGADGLPALGERGRGRPDRATACPTCSARERARYAGKRVLVLGAATRPSACCSTSPAGGRGARRPRSPGRCAAATSRAGFGGGAADQLPARGALGAACARWSTRGTHPRRDRFATDEIGRTDGALLVAARPATAPDDRAPTSWWWRPGLRPDLDFLRELRLDLDPALECPPALGAADRSQHPLLRHGARRTAPRELAQPEPGFYRRRHEELRPRADLPAADRLRAGALDRGRTSPATRRRRARVELVLPETGVCSGPGTRLADAEGCCGGPPLARTEACCAEDAAAKAAGGEGCGCGPPRPPGARAGRGGLLRHRRDRPGGALPDRRRGVRAQARRRHHRPGRDPNPGLGLQLLPAGGPGEADRGRHRLAAALGRGRALARAARRRASSRRGSAARSSAPAGGRSWRSPPPCSPRGSPAWASPRTCRPTSRPGS